MMRLFFFIICTEAADAVAFCGVFFVVVVTLAYMFLLNITSSIIFFIFIFDVNMTEKDILILHMHIIEKGSLERYLYIRLNEKRGGFERDI